MEGRGRLKGRFNERAVGERGLRGGGRRGLDN